MSISVGDKYVIEIGAVAELPEGKKKYFIKPFESLVFDRKGLKQLEKFDMQALKEYDRGYKKGLEDGKNEAIYNGELIDELKQVEYNKGYNSAINDYNAMYEWLHDCFVDFEKFLLEKGFYTDEKFSDGFVVGQLMYDLICDHDIAEVIAEFKKWREEKKKADEIRVGDEVKDLATNNIGVVLSIGPMIVYMTEINHIYSNTRGSLEKTGRHFGEEIEQLLSKLKERY